MTSADLLQMVVSVATPLFVVSSMLSMGFSLTIPQIIQPLRGGRLVVVALLANLVLVPLLAYLIIRLIPLQQPVRIGLIVLATAAGAPFVPKLVQEARGNIAFGVALMVLLMVATIAFMPVVLPLLLPGVSVDSREMARSLLLLMLVPLALGLLVRWRSPCTAQHWRPVMNKISNAAIVVVLVAALALNISNIIAFFGSGGAQATVLFILGALFTGSLVGGRDPEIRSAMGLGTAQRNGSAALIVVLHNPALMDTLPFVLVVAVIELLILLPVAKGLGLIAQKRHASTVTAYLASHSGADGC